MSVVGDGEGRMGGCERGGGSWGRGCECGGDSGVRGSVPMRG